MVNATKGLRGIGWKLFRNLGMAPELIEEAVRLALADLLNTRIHGFHPL